MSSSLEGVRVLDLSRLAAGNMISHMLLIMVQMSLKLKDLKR